MNHTIFALLVILIVQIPHLQSAPKADESHLHGKDYKPSVVGVTDIGCIYALCDPSNDEIKYIGQTRSDIERRRNAHVIEKSNCKKTAWIKSLKAKGVKPSVIEIDRVPANELNFWETHYIFLFRSWGYDLKNTTFGGDFQYGAGVGQIISMAKKGKKYYRPNYKHSLATKFKISKGNTGKIKSPELCKIISENNKGRVSAMKGVKLSNRVKMKKARARGGRRILAFRNGILVKSYPLLMLVEKDGFSTSKVCACCRGRRLTHKGYSFRYEQNLFDVAIQPNKAIDKQLDIEFEVVQNKI